MSGVSSLSGGPALPEVVVEAEAQPALARGGAGLVEIGRVGAPGGGGGRQATDLREVAVGREEGDRTRGVDDKRWPIASASRIWACQAAAS